MIAGIEWGPVGVWAGFVATVAIASVTALIALGRLSPLKKPRLRLTFQPTEPWLRRGTESYNQGLWIRIGVENPGDERTGPARGCVGRLVRVTTNGKPRPDVDPAHLRWASIPLRRAFDPLDVRHGQREFLDVALLADDAPWRIVTFEDDDFLRGFTVDLDRDSEHVFTVAVFSDNAPTVTCDVVARVRMDEIHVAMAATPV